MGFGVLLVVAAHEPMTVARPFARDSILIGRDPACELAVNDAELSRRHCEIQWLDGERFRVVDRGSHNGTYVNGNAVAPEGAIVVAAPAVVRAGGSVFVIERDIERYVVSVCTDGDVVGPVLRVAYDAIEAAARDGRHLFVDGENGTGKERAARVFHAASRNAPGRFVAINCATAHATRTFEEAENGVVFLDQLDALDPDAQRTTRARAEAVRGALVVVTAPAGEAYTRVVLPPVRERRAEIPFLVAHALGDSGLEPTAKLFEECLLRRWPANVRELTGAVRAAARTARAASAERVTGRDLPVWAGLDGDRAAATTTPDVLGLPLVHPR